MLEALQNIIIYGGSFLLVLGVVAFVHEYGHYQMARWLKIKVDTFCILGWGKTVLSWRDKAGVKWGIAPFPVGAYVSFVDDPDRYGPGQLQVQDPALRAEARAAGMLRAQSPAAKAAVSAAGPFANFIFATVAFALVFMIVGRDVTDLEALSPRIDVIEAGSAAADAGLRQGDVVAAINGRPIDTFGALREAVAGSGGAALDLLVIRDGGQVALSVTPRTATYMGPDGVEVRRYLLGVGRPPTADERQIERLGPIAALGAGAGQVGEIIAATLTYLGNIFTGRASPEHVAGPAGILDMSGQVAKGAWDAGAGANAPGGPLGALALALVGWAAMLSVAVGFVNLLPVPVLDGGHIVFYAIEAARGGKPMSLKAQEYAFWSGAAMIGFLFLFATWNDLQRLLG